MLISALNVFTCRFFRFLVKTSIKNDHFDLDSAFSSFISSDQNIKQNFKRVLKYEKSMWKKTISIMMLIFRLLLKQ